MGWISKRHATQGGSIGTGPKGGRHKGPLRKITKLIRAGKGLFDYDRVELECGHTGKSYGGVRARCGECGKLDPKFSKERRSGDAG